VKKLTALTLIVLLITMLSLSACNQTPAAPSASAPAAPAETSAAPEPAAPAEVIELSLSHSYPPQSDLGKVLEQWANDMGEQSGGRIKINVFPVSSLTTPNELYDGVANGTADIAYGHSTDDLGRYGIYTGFALVGLDYKETFPDVANKASVFETVRAKFPEVLDKHPDVEILYDCHMPPYVLQGASKEVRVPADMVGYKVAATGLSISLAEHLGAVPVYVVPPDRYTSLERNLIDGSWDVWAGIFAMKHYEVSNFYTEGVDFGAVSAMVVMNKAKLNSLPEDIQAMFRDQKNSMTFSFPAGAYLMETTLGREAAVEKGSTISIPTADELKLWDQAYEGYSEKWIKDMEDRGWPQARAFAEEIYKAVDALN